MNSLGAVVVLGLAGAAGGSFVSTAALRTASGEQVLRGRSRCDGCRRALTWVETIPLISYIARAGRCGSCRRQISISHPLGELAGMAAAIVLGLAAPSPVALAMTLMGVALLAAAIIDARTQRLPDPLTLVVAACASYLAFRAGMAQLWIGLLAAIISAAVLILLRWAFRRLRGEPSLGLGDVKLVAALAIWLGPETPMMIAGAAMLALVVLGLRPSKRDRIAFGPMLAFAGWSLGLTLELGLWPN